MLVNVSYTNKEVTRKVDEAVGKPFKLKERWAMNGIGSPKLFIKETSVEIRNLLILDNNTDSCNIEMRPKGIIVRFRSLLETFALVGLINWEEGSGMFVVFEDETEFTSCPCFLKMKPVLSCNIEEFFLMNFSFVSGLFFAKL